MAVLGALFGPFWPNPRFGPFGPFLGPGLLQEGIIVRGDDGHLWGELPKGELRPQLSPSTGLPARKQVPLLGLLGPSGGGVSSRLSG